MRDPVQAVLAGLLLSAAVLAGCAAPPGSNPRSSEEPSGGIRVEGMGSAGQIDVRREEVLREIGLPVYPGAKVVEGSQMAVRDSERAGTSYTARFHSSDGFDDVVKWYEKRLAVRALSAKVAGIRGSLITAPRDGRGTRTVTLTQKRDQKTVSITIARFVPGR